MIPCWPQSIDDHDVSAVVAVLRSDWLANDLWLGEDELREILATL